MRKWLVGILGIALVLLGLLVPLLLARHCPVNRAACERIEKGMTQAEVHAILGGPPGDYRTKPSGFHLESYSGPGPHDPHEQWYGDEGTVAVDYSRVPSGPDKVQDASFEPAEPHKFCPIEVMCWRLERLKNRWFP